MRVEYINPFIAAVQNVFSTMLSCEVRRGQPVLKENNLADHYVSGVIGLSGNAVGAAVLSMSESAALASASHMLMSDITEMSDDVLDAVGELVNIVSGAAKADLEEYNLMISLPNVITGREHEIHFPSDVKPLSIPFETDWGPITLVVGLSEVPQPAAV
jgi:chemotaxis protein CheX